MVYIIDAILFSFYDRRNPTEWHSNRDPFFEQLTEWDQYHVPFCLLITRMASILFGPPVSKKYTTVKYHLTFYFLNIPPLFLRS